MPAVESVFNFVYWCFVSYLANKRPSKYKSRDVEQKSVTITVKESVQNYIYNKQSPELISLFYTDTILDFFSS